MQTRAFAAQEGRRVDLHSPQGYVVAAYLHAVLQNVGEHDNAALLAVHGTQGVVEGRLLAPPIRASHPIVVCTAAQVDKLRLDVRRQFLQLEPSRIFRTHACGRHPAVSRFGRGGSGVVQLFKSQRRPLSAATF